MLCTLLSFCIDIIYNKIYPDGPEHDGFADAAKSINNSDRASQH